MGPSASASSAWAGTTCGRATSASSATSRSTRACGLHRAGVVGYIAKGVALAVVSGLFHRGRDRGNAEESSGLDGALRTLKEQPFGPALLTGIAAGIAVAYGLTRLQPGQARAV